MRRRRPRPLAACAILSLALSACDDSPTRPDPLPTQQAIQVAYFDALFELEGWGHDGAAAYCVSHGEWGTRQDPDSAVLHALQQQGRPEVIGNSRCIVNMQGTFRVDNGQQGQSFHIDSIALEGNQATVVGLYRNHPLGAGGYECTIVRDGDDWVAESCTHTWIA